MMAKRRRIYRKTQVASPSAQEELPFVAPMQFLPQELFVSPEISVAITQPGDIQEREADAMAERMTLPEPLPAESSPSGFTLQSGFRESLEAQLNSNFSGVRLHTDQRASEMSRGLNDQAFTYGTDIYFAEGQYAPTASEGKKLLAHELAHVAQHQHQTEARISRKVSDADVDADFQAWATKQSRKVNKNGPDYPQDLWDFVYALIFDPATYMPLAKPTKAADVAEWQKKFEKAEVVARWLIQLKSSSQNSSVQNQADSRAFGVLDALVQAGFVSQAVGQASGLSDANRKMLFEAILKNPSAASRRFLPYTRISPIFSFITFRTTAMWNPIWKEKSRTWCQGHLPTSVWKPTVTYLPPMPCDFLPVAALSRLAI